MESGLHNITSAATTTLADIYGRNGAVKYISLSNTHDSTAVTIELFLEDSSGNKSYIVKTDIPGKTTLVLSETISFDNSVLALKLTTSAGGLSTSTPLSVIIK